MPPWRPICMKRLAAAVLACSAMTASAGVAEVDPPPPQSSDRDTAAAGSPTSFNLGLTSTASLRVAWRHAAYGVGAETIALEAAPVPEPASASLALAGLAVLGALLARRRLEV